MDKLALLSEDQSTKLQAVRSKVVDSIGKNMDLYGVTMSIGHLYGTMYFNEQPVTLDEMSAAMGMSKTSISTGMRTLQNLKMINKVWERGSRKDLYEVVPDWHQNFSDYFSIRWRKAIEQNMNVLRKSLQELEMLLEKYPDDEQLHLIVQTDQQKINDALHYYNWLERLISSFETGEIFQYIPKAPL